MTTGLAAAGDWRAASPVRGDDWRLQAACRDVSHELFDTGSAAHNASALAFCDRCPVRIRCRDHMLDTPGAYSPAGVIAGGWVWGTGGVTPRHVHDDDLADRDAIIAAAHQRRLPYSRRGRHA